MIFLLVFGVLGVVFSIFWIKNPNDDSDLQFGVFSLISCIIMICLGLYLLSL